MSYLQNLYKKLPTGLQNMAVSTYGLYWHWLRFGPGAGDYLKQFKQRDLFSSADWNCYQQEQLRQLLDIAIVKVPFYRERKNEGYLAAQESGTLDDIPLLEKEMVRESPEIFLREDIHPFPKLVFHTSGTSGTPISSYWTKEELRKSMAVREARSVGWAGISFTQPRATFSGRIVEPDPESQGPFYRYNAAENQVYFSAFHLSPANAPKYVEALKKQGVEWLTGYAVSYYLLARYILDLKLVVPPLKAVITTSEKLTKDMRLTIKKAFNCRVYEEYSTVENVLFASECEYGRLHVSPDIGIVEILDSSGQPCKPSEIGEVVATCLFRNFQPMIRLRLGDLAAWDPEPCPCGRQMPVLKEVIGRIEDVVTGPDGRQLVRFHGIFTDQPNIIEGQIIQEKLDEFVVKIVPTENLSTADIEDVKQRMHQRLGPDLTIKVETVKNIPRSKSGKFKAVISKIE